MTGSRAARLAAPLSFLLPGLGQAALGRRRRGVLLALPAIAVVGGPGRALRPRLPPTRRPPSTWCPRPRSSALLVILEGAFLVWHLAAILDAERLGRAARPVRGWMRVPAALVLGAVLVASVALHGTIGLVEVQAGDALGTIFGPGGDGRR